MKKIIPGLLLFLCILGCDGKNGQEDAATDTITDAEEDSSADTGSEDGTDAVDGLETGCTSDSECDDTDPCTHDSCNTDSGDCSNVPLDADGDGFPAQTSGGEDCGGTDCDDDDDDVYPMSTTRRCGEDADCNSESDSDNDADGHDSEDCGGTDCDDDEPLRNPDAIPGCASDVSDPMSDLDCNGHIDADNDGDGQQREECSGTDCDDSRTDVYLDAAEICFDGVDQDCDDLVDGINADPGDVLMSVMSANHQTPVLLHDGTAYAGLYYRGSGSSSTLKYWFTRFESDGTRVVSDVGVTGTSNAVEKPDMTWTGSEYGVVWTDAMSNRDLYFTRVATDGSSLGSVERITQAMGMALNPSLVWSGSEFGLSWDDRRAAAIDIYFARISAGGLKVVSEVAVTENAEDSTLPSMVWTGSEYVIAYEESFTFGTDIYVERITPTGAPSGARIGLSMGSGYSSEPSLAWSGTELGLAWQDYVMGNWDLTFVRLSATGTRVGSNLWVANNSDASTSPSLVWTGSEYGLTYEDDSEDNLELFFLRIAPDGTFLDTPVHRITNASWESSDPSLCWAGSEYGVLFIDFRAMNSDLYLKPITFCD